MILFLNLWIDHELIIDKKVEEVCTKGTWHKKVDEKSI